MSNISTTNSVPLKKSIITSLGSGIEYYDFIIYGLMSKYLSEIFFVSEDKLINIVQIFFIFALGYIVRPIGGIVFGLYADMYGRKKTFLLIIFIMAVSTFAIAFLPTYSQAGVISPILLLICRLLQGLSHGAELPGAITMITETTNHNRLGNMCSIALSSTTMGSLIAIFVATFLAESFKKREILDYAWRIPFLLGGLFAAIFFYLRFNLSETNEFNDKNHIKNSDNKTKTILELMKSHSRNIIISIGLSLFMATLIITNIYFPTYISTYFSYNLNEIYVAMSYSMAASIIFTLIFGWISDYVPKTKKLIFSIICFSCSIGPLFLIIQSHINYALYIFFIVYQFWLAIFISSFIPILSRLFSTSIRCTAIAFSYNIAFSIASLIPSVYMHFFITHHLFI